MPAKRKSTAYLLWFFLGGVGAHKFYLGRPLAGALYIAACGGFWILLLTKTSVPAALVLSVIAAVSLVVDLFTIPSQVAAANGAAVSGDAAPATRRPMFAPKEEAPFDAAGADAAIARFKQQRSTPAAQTVARAPAGRPAFGRR